MKIAPRFLPVSVSPLSAEYSQKIYLRVKQQDSNIYPMTKIDTELLSILACPKCKAPVKEDNDGIRCTSIECRLMYPVKNGIPIMLIDEAVDSSAK
jgi:uncharacterized protein YbaR (Trm112 family)